LSACRVCAQLLDDLDRAVCEACAGNGHAAHGTRRTYQDQGCRCALCRAANAAYSAHYREAIHAGRPPLGAHVAGQDGHRVVAALVEDGYTRGAIATALGCQWPRLRVGAVVTQRTLYRLRRLHRVWTT